MCLPCPFECSLPNIAPDEIHPTALGREASWRGCGPWCDNDGMKASEQGSGERTDLDIPECYRELLVLKPDVPFRKSRIVDIERRFTVQNDHEVIALRSDLK